MLVSGSGSNLQALIDAVRRDPEFGARIVVVVSDRPGVRALNRAAEAGIPTEVVDWSGFDDRDTFTRAICDTVEGAGAEAMVLAGFMRILAPVAIERFPVGAKRGARTLVCGMCRIRRTGGGGLSMNRTAACVADALCLPFSGLCPQIADERSESGVDRPGKRRGPILR